MEHIPAFTSLVAGLQDFSSKLMAVLSAAIKDIIPLAPLKSWVQQASRMPLLMLFVSIACLSSLVQTNKPTDEQTTSYTPSCVL